LGRKKPQHNLAKKGKACHGGAGPWEKSLQHRKGEKPEGAPSTQGSKEHQRVRTCNEKTDVEEGLKVLGIDPPGEKEKKYGSNCDAKGLGCFAKLKKDQKKDSRSRGGHPGE